MRTSAQEVLYTPSATSPGTGIFALRQNVSFESFDGMRADGPFELDQLTYETAIAYGVTADLTLMGHLPLVFRDFSEPATSNSKSFGMYDLPVMLKYRFFQKDLSNIDTVRMSLLGGVELPSYSDQFSSESFDPFIGWAMTMIKGRHGIGAHAKYKWNTGGDPYEIDFGAGQSDAIRLDGSYLYRIDPVEYTIDTTKSTYVMIELNQRYETNGDYETLLSPGILIEAQTWAAELAIRLPINQHVDHRAQLDWAVTFGLRFTF
ncbi:MAG: hypothetical protein KTR15_05110 [Phycisphaeraceae bacterium]|nr:hypothetical protein [Phycisphaeraceae bacterium]